MQTLLVFLVVALAAAYSAWVLMPQGLRHWLVGRLMVVAPSRRAWLARLASNAENGGCSSCRGCAGRQRAPAPPGGTMIRIETNMDVQASRRQEAGERP